MAKVKEQVLIDYRQGIGTMERVDQHLTATSGQDEVPNKNNACEAHTNASDKQLHRMEHKPMDTGMNIETEKSQPLAIRELSTLEAGPESSRPSAGEGKDDEGKVDLELFFECFPNAFEAVARVLMYGVSKYGRRGLALDIKNARARYSSSMLRHKVARAKGEVINKESGCPHIWHETFNSLAALEESLIKEGEYPN